MKQNLEKVKFNTDQKVVYPVSNPITPTGGVVGLKGTLAPDGAIVKVAGLKKLQFRGPARVFDCEEDAFAAVEPASTTKATSSSFATRAPTAAPACARCCRRRRRSTARAPARRSR